MYTVQDDKVINEVGNIAVMYPTTVPHIVLVVGTEYLFSVQYNVNLTWVHPDHLSAIMAVKKECCGGFSRPKYVLANELAVRLWLGLGR